MTILVYESWQSHHRTVDGGVGGRWEPRHATQATVSPDRNTEGEQRLRAGCEVGPPPSCDTAKVKTSPGVATVQEVQP